MSTKDVLLKYATCDRTQADPASVIAILERLILPWLGGTTLFDPSDGAVAIRQAGLESRGQDPVLCYSSVVRGDEDNPALQGVRRMATSPLFYRLNYIRQLSTTNLAVNLDGTHNRLAHCLGTLDIASRLLAALRPTVSITPEEAKAVLIYALVHDCFHGPMGHTLDLVRDVIWGAEPDEERIDKHLLLKAVEQGLTLGSGALWKAVLDSGIAGGKEREIFQLLASFVAGEKKHFLAEIVDSDLDADRLDYIWRDYVHLRMGSLDTRTFEGLILSARVTESDGERHLAFSSDYASFVEELLDLRVKFYGDYYEHPLKQVADEMLAHVIYLVLKEEGLLGKPEILREFANRFVFLTDDGLFSLLTEITSKRVHEIPYVLFEDFRTNQPFRIVYKKGLHRENLAMLSMRVASLKNTLKKIKDEERENIRRVVHEQRQDPLGLATLSLRERVIARFNEAVKESVPAEPDNDHPQWKGALLPYTPEEDIYRLQLFYGGGFLKKLELEELLWKKLLDATTKAGVPFASALVPIAEKLAQRGFHTQAELVSMLRNNPLVFVTLSWIPGISEDELLSHQRGWRRNTIHFHSGGQADDSKAELTVKSRDEDYFLIISAPGLLLKARGMKQLIIDTFDKMLRERNWLPLDK